MDTARYAHSIQVGLSFGLVSGAITSLGLVVGLAAGTESRLAVIGGIVTIAIADSFSDALGIHVSEEAEGIHSKSEIWMATAATFGSKFLTSSTFLVPILLLELQLAVWVSIAWGLSAVGALSWVIARQESMSRWGAVLEHVSVAVVVIVATGLLGRWVSATFA
jgi:VIT1/CCC1 family predicted Fe2+/Mn2+ transporter